MKAEEYISGNELCLKECELSSSSDFVTKEVALEAISMCKKQMIECACSAFRRNCRCNKDITRYRICKDCFMYTDFVTMINMQFYG